jgi:hypothetical protein
MLDWLLSGIDSTRGHDVGFTVSWHARSMVLGWGVLAPSAIIIARFFKVTPEQDWPREVDNQFWWRCHLFGQISVLILSVIGFVLIYRVVDRPVSRHGWMGYAVLSGLVFQVSLGFMRGDKGGPTAPKADGSLRGDHYDMTSWRLWFERLHKGVGYSVIGLAFATITMGLWDVNAPKWMWLGISTWWVVLTVIFSQFQKRGRAVDTYQAIWGDDPCHPGNVGPPPGWGMRRLNAPDKGDHNVRDA